MSTIRKHLDFPGQSVILFMDLSFCRERGVYCKEWQVYDLPTKSNVLSRRELKEFDVRLLPADDLIELAKVIESTVASRQYGFESIKDLNLFV